MGALVIPVWLLAIVVPGVQVLPAVPSSFRTQPDGFTAAAVLRGEAVAEADCPGCAAIVERLVDPAQPRLTDGEVFWQVRHTLAAADAAAWDVTAYLRAVAAGREISRDGAWSEPIRAPDLGLRCGGTLTRLSDLRGEVLLVSSGYAQKVEGARAVNLTPARAAAGDCAALTDEALRAYRLVAGLPRRGSTLGHWFLVDGNGWLRGTGLGAPEILLEAVRNVAATPLSEARAHH